MDDEAVIYRPWYFLSAIALVVVAAIAIMTGMWVAGLAATTLAVATYRRALTRLRLARAGGRAR